MNTKSIIGIIIVVIILGLVILWLWKTPKQTQPPVVTPAATVTTTPPTPAAAASTTASTPPAPVNPPSPTAKSDSGIISTSTIDGMKIEVTKEGTGPEITNGQTAEMLYTGTLADGSIFDSTASRGNQPFSFTLGVGQVIKGWDEGVLGMKVGEERTLVIPPELAYGANGYPPVIPANATLTFQVTLVGIQ
jgi:peptidylprolyl isomerase